MNMENTSIARDNTIRTSQLKLANIARLIVNQRVNKAVEQLKFSNKRVSQNVLKVLNSAIANACLLYTSPSPRDKRQSRMPSSA